MTQIPIENPAEEPDNVAEIRMILEVCDGYDIPCQLNNGQSITFHFSTPEEDWQIAVNNAASIFLADQKRMEEEIKLIEEQQRLKEMEI